MVAELMVPVDSEKDMVKTYEKAFPMVARFVSKMKGSLDDAKDIFHDAMVIYYEKKREGHLQIDVPEEAYITGIAKHLWVRKFKKDCRHVAFDEMENDIAIPPDFYPSAEDNRLLSILSLTGQRCMDILKSFYYDKISIRDITRKFGYSNEHTASVQKYKCLDKVRDHIRNKSIAYEDLQ